MGRSFGVKKWLISAAGKDRPGIVAAVTRPLYESHCNIEDTSMTRLEDHFAMLVIALAPPGMSDAELSNLLAPVKQRFDLQLDLHSIDAEREHVPPRGRTWMIAVSGPDQTGILYHVTRLLAARGVNIGSLSSKCLTRDGRAVFLMSVEAEVPEGVPEAELREELATLARQERLEIHAEPLEEYTL